MGHLQAVGLGGWHEVYAGAAAFACSVSIFPAVSAYPPGRRLACRVARGGVMAIPAEATRPDNGFTGALHVSGPAGEHAGKLMLFGQFVGSWDLEWAGTGANGEPATAAGELHVPGSLDGMDHRPALTAAARSQTPADPTSGTNGGSRRFRGDAPPRPVRPGRHAQLRSPLAARQPREEQPKPSAGSSTSLPSVTSCPHSGFGVRYHEQAMPTWT